MLYGFPRDNLTGFEKGQQRVNFLYVRYTKRVWIDSVSCFLSWQFVSRYPTFENEFVNSFVLTHRVSASLDTNKERPRRPFLQTIHIWVYNVRYIQFRCHHPRYLNNWYRSSHLLPISEATSDIDIDRWCAEAAKVQRSPRISLLPAVPKHYWPSGSLRE